MRVCPDYARVTKLAIYRFHKSADANVAREYFHATCTSVGLINESRVALAEVTLDRYITWALRCAMALVPFRNSP